ncbi:hypothetical protein D9M71_133780 [compost metagenome]
MLSSPHTKLMCGVVLMNECGFFSTPWRTCHDQNWREIWKASLISMALEMFTLPSLSSGV